MAETAGPADLVIASMKKWLRKLGLSVSRRGGWPRVTWVRKPFFDRRVYARMSLALTTPTSWTSPPGDDRPRIAETIAASATGAIWSRHPGGIKWVDYFKIYDREFAHLRGKDARILEIGVYRGASLKLWREFFGGEATIVGIDIDPNCAAYADPASRVHVRIGSQADEAFLRSVVAEFGPFDLIIDDGSHVVSHQIASFNALFMHGLKTRGLYFVEDLEGNYWGDTSGHIDQDITMIDHLKTLIDLENDVFRGREYADFSLDSPSRMATHVVPAASTAVERVSFYRGVAVVQRAPVEPPVSLHI